MSDEITAVRAKMVCNNLGQSTPDGAVTKVQLGCVYSTTGENASFTRYTPWGACEMGIDADAPAASFFKPGKRYYVTFTEAPD
jgi:hypothetical protein